MILIVGAGITGLSVANFLHSKDYLIIEKEKEPGGYCRTIKQDGFTWDYSGHFFHFRHPDIKDFLVSRMDGQEILTVQKKSKIYYKGTYVDFPFQKNIHQLPKEDFLECLHDLYFRDGVRGETFKDMLLSNFGKGICEKFLFPYNEKLYACNLDELDKDAMGRFFPRATLDDVIKNFRFPDNSSYNSTFTYPKGGAFEYVKALLRDIEPEKVSLGERLLSVDYKSKIAHTDKRSIKYDKLVNTAPFNRLMDLMGIEYDRSIYIYNKVLVFNLGFDKKGDAENHWIYFPDRQVSFYRVGYYDNIFDDDRMSLYVEISLESNEEYDANSLLEQTLSDLRGVGLVKNQKLMSWKAVILDPAYVHINAKAQKDFASKSVCLKDFGVYTVGRYGGWRYCSIEDNIIEARGICNELA